MKDIRVLEVKERRATGKGGARKIRASGMCPAVIYGQGVDAMSLQVDNKSLQKVLGTSGSSNLIDLEITCLEKESPEKRKVIIRDVAYSPIGNIPEHVDFYQVSLDRPVTITVPVKLVGICEAVENKTGTISQQIYELSVECLPTKIPDFIEIDISAMTLGHSIHVREVQLSSGIEMKERPELSIVSVTAIKVVEEEEEVVPELESAEPAVIGQDITESEAASGE